MHYFDYTATTPIDNEVLDTYIKVSNLFFANTTSLHRLGQESNYMYQKMKEELKCILNVQNHDIIYTSNATEANNLAIFGVVKNYAKGRIITTCIEHPSVYEVMKNLEKEYEVIYLSVDECGRINLNELEQAMNQDVILVSIMWVNNIVGTIEPIDKIIQIVSKYKKAKLHIDAVQGMCKVEPNFSWNDVDLFTFSTHKIYGPKGIGGLVYRKDIQLSKRLYGSNAQNGIKPGTLDVSLISSTTKAFKKFYPLTSFHQNDVLDKFNYLYNNLKELPFVIINTPLENISHYIINISIPSLEGETIVHILEDKEIYVSTGSSCSSKLKVPEKTIMAMTKNKLYATTSIRISLSHLVTKDDLDILIKAIKEVNYV